MFSRAIGGFAALMIILLAVSAPAQQSGDDKKKAAEESFRKMIEFIGLDEQQAAEAGKLFEARFREISEITERVQSGDLKQQEAGEKLAGSFKTYREKFEKLLSEEQKARLEQWENPSPAKAGKKRSALNDSERVSQGGPAATLT